MLNPVTGEGARPSIGRSAGLDETSIGLDFGEDGPVGPCAGSAGTTAPSLFFNSGAGALGSFSGDAVGFSEEEVGFSATAACFSAAGARFCLSSVSSDWMRCSIASSFFNKASFTSPSAARAPLQLMMDIAAAASSAFRLQRRSGLNIDTGKRGNWCNDIGAPAAEIKDSATHLTPLQNISGIRKWSARLESLHFRIRIKLKYES